MAERIAIPPLSEPQIVSCFFASGVEIEMLDGVVRLVGWVSMEAGEGDQPERRIVTRFVMPNNVARKLCKDLQRVLSRGGH